MGEFFKSVFNVIKEIIYFIGENWVAIVLIIILLMMVYLIYNIAYIPNLIKKAAAVIDAQMQQENESYEEFIRDWMRTTTEGGPTQVAARSGSETDLINLFEEGGD